MKILKGLLAATALACVFFVGMKAGPALQLAYSRANPPPLYTVGDYRFTEDSGTQAVVFSTSTCPFCKRLRSFLDAKKITYKDYVTDVSGVAKAKYEITGEQVVPVIFVGRKKFVGFNGRIAKAIESAAREGR